jgi:hypothetical protein
MWEWAKAVLARGLAAAQTGLGVLAVLKLMVELTRLSVREEVAFVSCRVRG